MAKRRMFSPQVICSDAFIDLSAGAKSLYLYLGIVADDDGIITGINAHLRFANSGISDLEELLESKFLLKVKDAVVIRHWKTNNQIRKDTYVCTRKDIVDLLIECDDGSYTVREEFAYSTASVTTTCEHNVNGENPVTTTCEHNINSENPVTQCSVVKCSVDKGSVGECSVGDNPPTPSTENENYFSVPITSGELSIDSGQLEQYQRTYKSLDIKAELSAIVNWLKVNPDAITNLKKTKGFIRKWLDRAEKNPKLRKTSVDPPSFDIDEFYNAALARSHKAISG